MRSQLFQKAMRLLQVFTACPLALVKVRHRIEPQPVNAHGKPEITDFFDRFVDRGIIKIQIRLVRIKAVPVIRFCHWIPRPVRRLKIFKDDTRVLEFLRRIAPDVKIFEGKITTGDCRFGAAGIANAICSYVSP